LIYVVSGFMRTGTSMLMNSLIAGGLDAFYREGRDQMNHQWGDDHYQPNGDGFFEPQREDFQNLEFPRMHDGKLIKCLYGGLSALAVHSYRVVFMGRNSKEVKQSIMGFFKKDYLPQNQESIIRNFDAVMNRIVEMASNRKDVLSLHRFQYREVLESPLKHFIQLEEAGWPIDPIKASGIVDPSRIRFKAEELEVM